MISIVSSAVIGVLIKNILQVIIQDNDILGGLSKKILNDAVSKLTTAGTNTATKNIMRLKNGIKCNLEKSLKDHGIDTNDFSFIESNLTDLFNTLKETLI